MTDGLALLAGAEGSGGTLAAALRPARGQSSLSYFKAEQWAAKRAPAA